MNGKILKTIKHYLRNSGFWKDNLNKNMTFAHKAIIALTYCNITIFIVYGPIFDPYFI